MPFRRRALTLRLLGLLTLFALALGPATLAGARGVPVRIVTRGLTAEPLPPEAFEPAIVATPGDALAGALTYRGDEPPPDGEGLAVDIPQMPGIMTVMRTLPAPAGDDEEWELDVLYPDGQARDFTIFVPKALEVGRHRARSFAIILDGRNVPVGEARTATILFSSDHDDCNCDDHDSRSGDGVDRDRGQTLRIPVHFVRSQAVVRVESSCEPGSILRGDQTTCTITLTNTSAADAEVALLSKLPRQLRVVRDSVTGGKAVGRDRVIFRGTLPAHAAAGVSAVVDGSAAPVGYVPLRLLGIAPVGDVGDETLSNVAVPAFSFGRATYTRLGIVSNGYLVLGGGAAEDIRAENTPLPDSGRPNGTLAPFWTNLDPGAGGAIRVATVSDGRARWLVVDFDGVPNRAQPTQINSFQVWIGLDAPDTISFVYGPALTGGAGGLLTVGAESADGSSGATIYYNGSGQAPAPSAPFGSFAVGVTATPGQAATHTVSFRALGYHKGPFVGYSFLLSSAFEGIAVDRFSGEVLERPEDD